MNALERAKQSLEHAKNPDSTPGREVMPTGWTTFVYLSQAQVEATIAVAEALEAIRQSLKVRA